MEHKRVLSFIVLCYCLFSSLTKAQQPTKPEVIRLFNCINAVNCKPVCKNNQIAIVLDTSGTISNTHLQQAKNLAKKIVDRLELSSASNSNKLSLVSYASTASKRIYCDEHTSSSAMNTAIEKLERIDGELTNTQAGLEAGFEILNERGCNGEIKSYKQHTLILISDGKANRGIDLNGPNATAAAIRAKNVRILAIGVGDVTYTELVGIAGSEESVIHGYTELNAELEKILNNKLTSHFCQNTDPGPCFCDIDDKILDVKTFTKIEIIREYNGSCYVDKLEAAITTTTSLIEDLKKNIENMEVCKTSLITSISSGKNDDLHFKAYDSCTLNLSCSIKEALWKLEQKKEYMENELKIEKSGFGELTVTGTTKWLFNKLW